MRIKGHNISSLIASQKISLLYYKARAWLLLPLESSAKLLLIAMEKDLITIVIILLPPSLLVWHAGGNKGYVFTPPDY